MHGCVIQKRCIHTLALDPMLLHHSRVMGASSGNGSKVTGSTSVLRVKRTLRNFFLSPINIALATQGNCFLIVSSIGIGATFSPPAVMRISLARPEILEIIFLEFIQLIIYVTIRGPTFYSPGLNF